MSSVNVESRLYDAIGDHYEELSELKLGTEERKAAFNELDRLMDKAIELEKIEVESRDKAAARESEELLKKQQMEDEKKDRVVKNTISVAGIVISTGATIWGVLKSLKFEETGTVTTMAGRNFIQRLFSKK